MATINEKYFLDLEGLAQYDELIKQYVLDNIGGSNTIKNMIASLNELAEATEQNASDIKSNKDLIDIINGNVDTEGSIANLVSKAVNDIIDGAPETLDTLKEISEWIAQDETGTAALINRVSANEEKIEDLKEYVDTQDKAYFDSILSIKNLKIASLFPVKQGNATVKELIESLEEGKAAELTPNQVIEEDLTIDKSCYINANGSTFTGTVTVPADVEVIIENAEFSKPIVKA